MNINERRKWNNILIFVCSVLIVALGIFNYQPKEKQLNQAFATLELEKIAFSGPSFQYTFNLKNKTWFLSEPFSYPIIENKLQAIEAIQSAAIFKHISNSNPDEFNFNDEHYLILNNRKYFFGDKAINSEHRYTMIDGRIFLIDNSYYALLNAGPTYWMDTFVLPESDDLLTSISINKDLYKEADLINLAGTWYDAKAKNLLYPADKFINPTAEDTPITVSFANDKSFQFIMHKEIFLMNTTYNLAYELDAKTASSLLIP